jgi:hypothetical protein
MKSLFQLFVLFSSLHSIKELKCVPQLLFLWLLVVVSILLLTIYTSTKMSFKSPTLKKNKKRREDQKKKEEQ